MGFILFLCGGFFGMVIMSVFSARAYEKGYKDGKSEWAQFEK
jgi:hypothetical protein